nr:hypothetical protein [Syntrophorhabdus aromaticivorans]
MKAIRFTLSIFPEGSLTMHGGLSIRLTGDHPSLDILIKARMRIMELGRASPG